MNTTSQRPQSLYTFSFTKLFILLAAAGVLAYYIPHSRSGAIILISSYLGMFYTSIIGFASDEKSPTSQEFICWGFLLSIVLVLVSLTTSIQGACVVAGLVALTFVTLAIGKKEPRLIPQEVKANGNYAK